MSVLQKARIVVFSRSILLNPLCYLLNVTIVIFYIFIIFMYKFIIFVNLRCPMFKPETEGATPQIEPLFQKH